jgi:DNA ligase D
MASPFTEIEVSGHPIKITNPDKVYFPEVGVRKMDLVDYYIAVGDGIVRALRERPTYLQRFPEGITGEEVYQKRLPKHAPEWMQTVHITFPSGRSADALCVTDVADVVWAAQQSTITFHPWHTRADDTDHPDELRIDLDPQPGTDFEDARRVAVNDLRPLLDELGFIGWPKTSGGRGLHIYVRIEPKWTFTDIRHAAISLGRELERRAPMEVTTKWWKEERGQRLFVDYNQNSRDRTIASAYSARRTPIATVSAPITWDELPDVHPNDLTVRTMPARFAALGDPHAGIDDKAHDITTLLEWYVRDEASLGDMPYPPNYPKMPGEPMRVQPSRARKTE